MSQESSWIAKNMASPGKGGKGQYKRMKTKEKVYLPALVVAVLVGVFVCVWEWWVGGLVREGVRNASYLVFIMMWIILHLVGGET